ncbi:hypothetical protein AB0J83_40475 [Actinoplanes sp. NPDC049596]|uniref:hypothetical protein n=1 Tax=unclassified Actinoplanes TaxID=2626549 RepID=UPI00343FBA2A
MPRFGSKATRRVAALFVASAAVVLTAACGGGDSGDSPSANGRNTQGGNNAFTAYIECLSKNGVTITMPSGGPRNGASGFPRPDRSGGPRPSGSAFPRPSGSAGAGNGGFRGGGMFNQKPEGVDDAIWQKAQTACASVRPTGRPGGGQGNGNGSNAAYQNCLKDNGVTDTSNLDTTNATVKKAMETCKVLAPTASASTGS